MTLSVFLMASQQAEQTQQLLALAAAQQVSSKSQEVVILNKRPDWNRLEGSGLVKTGSAATLNQMARVSGSFAAAKQTLTENAQVFKFLFALMPLDLMAVLRRFFIRKM